MRVNKLTLIFALLLAAGCTPHRSAPTSVSIAHSHPDPELLTWEWSTDDADFRVDEFLWVNAAVELHICEPDEWAWSDLLVSPAYAHVSSSATRLGVPLVEAFNAKQTGARVVGELSPEPETFCRGYLIIAPADDDVMNLTDIATADLIGASFFMRGSYRPASSQESIPFEVRTSETFVFEFPLVDPITGEKTVAVESGSNVLLTIQKSARDLHPMIQSVDELRDPSLAKKIVRAIGASVKQTRPGDG